MKKQITLTIEKPCSESFDNFIPTSSGGFCTSCSKNVVDFTRMSDDEIRSYFADRWRDTCGKFTKEQLNTTYSETNTFFNYQPSSWVYVGFLSFLLFLTGIDSRAQIISTESRIELLETKVRSIGVLNNAFVPLRIEGVVRNEENFPIPGVNILLKGTETGTVSDAEGKFKFPAELSTGDTLVFSFIGLETQEYIVPKNIQGPIEIEMLPYEEILGEIVVGGVYADVPDSGISRWWNKLKNIF